MYVILDLNNCLDHLQTRKDHPNFKNRHDSCGSTRSWTLILCGSLCPYEHMQESYPSSKFLIPLEVNRKDSRSYLDDALLNFLASPAQDEGAADLSAQRREGSFFPGPFAGIQAFGARERELQLRTSRSQKRKGTPQTGMGISFYRLIQKVWQKRKNHADREVFRRKEIQLFTGPKGTRKGGNVHCSHIKWLNRIHAVDADGSSGRAYGLQTQGPCLESHQRHFGFFLTLQEAHRVPCHGFPFIVTVIFVIHSYCSSSLLLFFIAISTTYFLQHCGGEINFLVLLVVLVRSRYHMQIRFSTIDIVS
ncbi:hypothetical protein VNO77_22890 [Canavalia gladiata]|uniref:Uncharacterized protein n=1 Tax=Canavalia gladiata TaxID=3824 RepID=A0AAN9L3G4_CANGL